MFILNLTTKSQEQIGVIKTKHIQFT